MARAGLCRRTQLQQPPHLSLRPVYAFDRFSGTAAPRAGLRKLGVRRADQQKAGQRGARSLPGGNRLHARAAQTPRQSPSPALASGGDVYAAAHSRKRAGVFHRRHDACPRQRNGLNPFRRRADAGGLRHVRGGAFPALSRARRRDHLSMDQRRRRPRGHRRLHAVGRRAFRLCSPPRTGQRHVSALPAA